MTGIKTFFSRHYLQDTTISINEVAINKQKNQWINKSYKQQIEKINLDALCALLVPMVQQYNCFDFNATINCNDYKISNVLTQKIRLDSIEFHKAYFSSHTFLLEVLEKSRLLGNNTDLSIEEQSLILIKLQIKLQTWFWNEKKIQA